jgi:hypothetical protein
LAEAGVEDEGGLLLRVQRLSFSGSNTGDLLHNHVNVLSTNELFPLDGKVADFIFLNFIRIKTERLAW